MTAPLVLQVPAPALVFTPAGGGAPLEQAVTIDFAEVRFPDGSAMTADDYAGAVAVLGRTNAPGAAPEVWDAAGKTWRPLAGSDLSQLGGIPLIPPTGGGAPWKGLLLGAAERDAGGNSQIRAALGHFPQYTVRGAFQARRGTTRAHGVGPQSTPIEFAESVKVLEVDTSTATPVITILNRSPGGTPMARVRLEDDGGITLIPAAGRRVVIQGDLEVEHVRYLPVGGVVKADL